MKLGMQVGLGPGHIVLDRDPAPPPPKGHSPLSNVWSKGPTYVVYGVETKFPETTLGLLLP